MKNIFTKSFIKTSGYKIINPIDAEKFPNKENLGLEGPYTLKSGKVVYYDPKGKDPETGATGCYYDSTTDMYMPYSEYESHMNPR
jgi:hypothetical protein